MTDAKQYYNTFGIDHSATPEQIRKKYLELSKKYHPDKPTGNEEKFKKLTEAYETLGNPEKKRAYDLPKFGEKVNANFARGRTNNFFFRTQNAQPFYFSARNNGTSFNHQQPKHMPNISHTMKLTLKELYTGVFKKINIKRNRIGNNNTIKLEEHSLEVKIPPGMKNDQIYVIPGEGNQYNLNLPPGNINLKIHQLNHEIFTRKGANLLCSVTISLKEALCGYHKNFKHIDESIIPINIDTVIKPNMEHYIHFKGMPIPNKDGSIKGHGSLVLKFNVQFPETITQETKGKLQSLL